MYDTIVVGFYKSVTGREAVQQATALAAAFDAKLHLVTSFDPKSKDDDDRIDAERQLAAHELGAPSSVETHVLGGEIGEVIIDVADRVGADLIIVGNKELRGSKRVTDSVAGSVSASASCAVLIVPTS